MKLVLWVVLLLWVPLPCFAQGDFQIKEDGATEGKVSGALQGDGFMAVTSGKTIQIRTTTAPFTLLSKTKLKGKITKFEVVKKKIYVQTTEDIYEIDASDPTKPVIKSVSQLLGGQGKGMGVRPTTNTLTTSGTTVYSGAGVSFTIYQDTATSYLVQRSQVDLPSFVSDIKPLTQNGFVANYGNSVGYVEAQDVAHPFLEFSKDVGGQAGGLAVFNDFVFVGVGAGNYPGSMAVLQFNEATGFQVKTTFTLQSSFDGPLSICVVPGDGPIPAQLYVAGSQSGVWAYNINNPMIPMLEGTIPISGGATFVSVDPATKRLFATDTKVGGFMYDATNIASPVKLATFSGAPVMDTVWLDSTHMYAACDSYGLRLIDVSDKTNPVEVSRNFYSVAPDFLLKLDANHIAAGGVGGVSILDATNRTTPTQQSFIDLFFTQDMVATSHSLVAVSGAFPSDLNAYDTTSFSAPVKKFGIKTPSLANGIAIGPGGTELYVADGGIGIAQYAYNSNILSATLQRTFTPPTIGSFPYTNGITVNGNLLGLANGGGYGWFYQLNGAQMPTQLSYFPFTAVKMALAPPLAYIAGSQLGVVDIGDLANPLPSGNYDGGGPAGRVHVWGGEIYLAMGDIGLSLDSPTATFVRPGQITDYLLGKTSDPTNLDINRDFRTDVADLQRQLRLGSEFLGLNGS